MRLLLDPPASGAFNMAFDEALLEGLIAGTSPPTLRFYGWNPPALSLGYGQKADVVDLGACRRLGVDLIRRPTGGRAVLHVQELTYSVTMPSGRESVAESYRRISRAIARAIAGLGVTAELRGGAARAARVADCFALSTAADLAVGGRKLVGSAQVRRHGCFLQHGSIKLAPASLDLAELLPGQTIARPAALSDFLEGDPAYLADALARAIAAELDVPWRPASALPAEVAAARTSAEVPPIPAV